MKNLRLTVSGLFVIFMLSGCAVFHSAPPLKESEVPFRIKPGSYTDTAGGKHKVSDEYPRWCVSEAYLYDAVKNASTAESAPVKLASVEKKFKITKIAVAIGVLVIGFLLFKHK